MNPRPDEVLSSTLGRDWPVMMRHRSRSRAGRPTSYQIVVRGELSQRFSTAFEGMALEAEDGQTTITGPVVDQAHLHGLLDRVRDLGLELVSVNATITRAPPHH